MMRLLLLMATSLVALSSAEVDARDLQSLPPSSGVLALTKACNTSDDCASTATCDAASGRCRVMAAGECRAEDPRTCACETTIDCPRFFECRRDSWRPIASCTPY